MSDSFLVIRKIQANFPCRLWTERCTLPFTPPRFAEHSVFFDDTTVAIQGMQTDAEWWAAKRTHTPFVFPPALERWVPGAGSKILHPLLAWRTATWLVPKMHHAKLTWTLMIGLPLIKRWITCRCSVWKSKWVVLVPSSSITYWELASVAVIRSFSVIFSTEDGFTSSAEMILGKKKLPFAVEDSSLLLTSSHFAISDTCSS